MPIVIFIAGPTLVATWRTTILDRRVRHICGLAGAVLVYLQLRML
jgi:hypothetical protein